MTKCDGEMLARSVVVIDKNQKSDSEMCHLASGAHTMRCDTVRPHEIWKRLFIANVIMTRDMPRQSGANIAMAYHHRDFAKKNCIGQDLQEIVAKIQISRDSIDTTRFVLFSRSLKYQPTATVAGQRILMKSLI
jgi:hypothetical protein